MVRQSAVSEQGLPWEARRARRYGSEHMGSFSTEAEAVAYANEDIAAHGGVGEITTILDGVVYYNVYEEN